MIDLDKALKEFEYYVSDYDLTEETLKQKYEHSKRVMDNCISIATNIGLSIEDVQLVGLIGLLHDIARFDQYKIYKTFVDILSFDHGKYGVRVLFNPDYIRDFVVDDKYDSIIKKSIYYHNKFSIGKCDDREFLFSQIIRDADKIDLFEYYVKNSKVLTLEETNITPEIYKKIMERNSIRIEDCKTDVDRVMLTLGMIFDLNFKYSIETVKRHKYVDQLIDKYINNIDNQNTVNQLTMIKESMNDYLEKR